MDHQPVVTGTVVADQAVFTSARSAMGEGYRLIACSPGLRAGERAEITQRSPSHAGLTDDATSTVGLSSYHLASGRFCVAFSCYAGTEQTGRGGNRVYTHLAILDREAFLAFKFDPIRVHSALAQAIGDSRVLQPDVRLEPMTLKMTEPLFLPPFQMDHVAFLIDSLIHGRALVAAGFRHPFEAFQWLILALPMSVRENLSVTIGVRFSLSRHIRLAFIPTEPNQSTRQLIRGHDVLWLDMEAAAPKPTWPENGWINLVQRRWKEGQFNRIARICEAITGPIQPDELDRIAGIAADIDQIQTADSTRLEQLIIKHVAHEPAGPAELELITQFRNAAKERAALLQNNQDAPPLRPISA